MQAAAHGSLRVEANEGDFEALARHVARRCGSLGRRCVTLLCSRYDDPWRRLAQRFGDTAGGSPHASATAWRDGDVAAEEMAAAVLDELRDGVLVVATTTAPTRWANLVAEAVRARCRAGAPLLLIELSGIRKPGHGERVLGPRTVGEPAPNVAATASIDERVHCGELSAADRFAWWSAAVAASVAVQRGPQRLQGLDAWWEQACGAPADVPDRLHALGPSARQLLDTVQYVGMALTRAQLLMLGDATDLQQLENAGVLLVEGDSVLPRWHSRSVVGATSATPEPHVLRRVVATLTAAPSPWSALRAAEVAAELGDGDGAERWADYALERVTDRTARQDVWTRYLAVLSRLQDASHPHNGARDGLSSSGGEVLERLLRAAGRAFKLGDGERAEELTRRAVALDSQRFDVLFAHSRACQLRGDLTSAALSLKRALSCAHDDGERARAAALMAQVRLVAGDAEQARAYAEKAMSQAVDARTRLDGRNVLGKLLLAGDAWDAAEVHFASDAYEAAIAGEHEAELRARLNRAVAVLSLGRKDQARRLLEQVLEAGQQRRLPRAMAFALSNLGTVAILQQRFADALVLSERAITIRSELGVRHGMVQPITNLAELRLMVGMVDEAEASLRFGLRSCGSNLPAPLFAYFAKAMAQVHLARGETAKAQRWLAGALSGAASAGNAGLRGQCHRIAARIALVDGDVARARATLARAQACRQTGFGVAEVVLIEAQVLCAAGEDYVAVAERALVLAEQVASVEATLEACLLLAQGSHAQGDSASAQLHLEHAQHVRDGVVEALPSGLRERYLARSEMQRLRQMEAMLRRAGAHVCNANSSVLPARDKGARPRLGDAGERAKLVGSSRLMQSLRAGLERVATTDVTVLVQGETGTGKELVAEAIHAASGRADGPLVKVNCAALVETLLLSELFGHERGAFTGAQSRRQGRFEMADGGTLFLDEIGDISPRTQVALLRVLQDGAFERVGGGTTLHCDVRVIVATHRDLRSLVAEGKFREDLYYRLCGMVVNVPTLRERTSDIPELAEALLARAQRRSGVQPRPLSAQALSLLQNHDWPGNVRQLQNALRAAALFASGPEITAADFTDNVAGMQPARPPRASTPAPDDGMDSVAPSSGAWAYAEIRTGVPLADLKRRLEQECISQALVETGGNITRAAELLGMRRPRLSQLVKKYQLANVIRDAKS